MTVNLLGLSRSELISYCAELGEKPFRAKQLLHWIHQTGAADFSGMTDMSKAFRERLAGIAEIYVTLFFISKTVAPTLLTAFILESVNRVINVVFKFVPLRTGVDEYGSGALAKVLGFTRASGVTLAIVRKARDIFWTTIGVGLIVRRGLSLRAATYQDEEVGDGTTSVVILAAELLKVFIQQNNNSIQCALIVQLKTK